MHGNYQPVNIESNNIGKNHSRWSGKQSHAKNSDKCKPKNNVKHESLRAEAEEK